MLSLLVLEFAVSLFLSVSASVPFLSSSLPSVPLFSIISKIWTSFNCLSRSICSRLK